MSNGLGPNQTDFRTPLPDNFYNPATRAADLLHERIYTDSLTGLLNRDGVQLILSELATQQTPAFLTVVDIDDVKLINDNFGHDTGNELFTEVAERLQHSLRTDPTKGATDIIARGRKQAVDVGTEQREHVGRVGGDEFIGIIPVAVSGNAHTVYQVLHERLSQALSFHSSASERLATIDPPRTIHASFGIAYWDPIRGVPATESLRVADRKMYEAKAHFKSELHP